MPRGSIRQRCEEPFCRAWAVRRGKCEEHAPAPWSTPSANTEKLTSADRDRFRRTVLRRDPVCRICGDAPATIADHVLAVAEGGSLTDPANGQGVCKPCHDRKTASEGQRGRKRGKVYTFADTRRARAAANGKRTREGERARGDDGDDYTQGRV